MATLGLAASHNYWALLILVSVLWKFGSPETLMHLYLGVFIKGVPFMVSCLEVFIKYMV